MTQLRHTSNIPRLLVAASTLLTVAGAAGAQGSAGGEASIQEPACPAPPATPPTAAHTAQIARQTFDTNVFETLRAEAAGEPAPAASPEVQKAAKEKKEEAKTGADTKSDYTAKHFSLLTGAVVLNPYTISKNESGQFVLDNSDTTANAFIEGGMRWRWAWLDRIAPVTAAKWQLAQLQDELQAAGQTLEDLGDKWKLGRVQGDRVTAEKARKQFCKTKEKIGQLEAKVEAARTTLEANKAAWETGLRERTRVSCPLCTVQEGDLTALVPADWTARMGFAFSSGQSGAAGIAGASDFYSEFGAGINIFRWDLPTSTPEETPIRGSFSLESALSLTTDRDALDVHERPFFGASVAFGVPLSLTGEEATPAEAKDKSPKLKPAPIAELVARLGVVRVDLPRFDDPTSPDSRVVKSTNGSPAFEGKWGGGFDMELNVPIAERLGYLVARGSTNFGFDPNPWTLTLGYTIPISQFGKVLAGDAK